MRRSALAGAADVQPIIMPMPGIWDFVDLSPAARPGLDTPLAASLIAAVGQEPKPKYGWTDVARLSEIGIPAVNFGPGDALLAHTDNEHVRFSELNRCYSELRSWLMSD